MAWLEVHQSLQRHPKLLRLSAKLRIHRAQSAGHLLFLWLWTLDYAPTGDLSAFGPAEISAAADYPGDAEIFTQALQDCGWLDKDGNLHDWYEYAGKLIERRAADKERKRDVRKTPQSVPGTSDGHPADGARTLPNLTKPNHKRIADQLNAIGPENRMPPADVPDLPATRKLLRNFVPPGPDELAAYCRERGSIVDPQRWMDHYLSNGWKVGKNTMKDWKACVRNWEKSAVPGRAERETSLQPDFIRSGVA